MINEVENQSKYKVDADLTLDFFNEIKGKLPDIDKTFEDLVSFNDKLQKNKLNYLKTVQENFDTTIGNINKERQRILEENKAFVSLIADNKIDEYNLILKQLTQREREISERERNFKIVTDFSKNIEQINQKIKSLGSDSHENSLASGKMSKFNGYFTKISSRISGERPVLTYNSDPNDFPLSITELEGTSTGTRK